MSKHLGFSNRGHILASIGGAIGVANLVLFPARMQNYGGLAFALTFVLITFIMGVPLMIGEASLGKNGQSNAVDAYRGIGGKAWAYAGYFGMIVSAFILSFYVVLAAWAMYYLYLYLFDYGLIAQENPGRLFGTFISNTGQVILFSALVIGICIWVVAYNVRQGIENVSRTFVPLLLLLMLFLILSIPLITHQELHYTNFTFRPGDLFVLDASGKIGIIEAVGQAFFSLSLGATGMITYGSHIHKDTHVVRNAHYIVHTDTMVAIFAAILIIPLFAPSDTVMAAPPLVFINLVDTFRQFGPIWGRLIGLSFFVLFNLAILTSAISLLETPVNYLSKNLKRMRPRYAILLGLLVFIFSIPATVSVNPNSSALFTNFLGYGDASGGQTTMGYFNFLLDFFGTFGILMGGFLLATFIRTTWKIEGLFQEITVPGYTPSPGFKRYMRICLNWIAPILLLLLFAGEFIKVLYKLQILA